MQKFNKFKSVILSGMIAAASVAGSFASVAAPSLSASAAGSDDYAKLLQYSLYFYDANMCGDKVGETSALTWRDDCHTSDEVKGGFHDAGDHAMFGLPQGYTASTLGWSFYEFKDAYNATGQAEHLKVLSDHFNEFFKASTKLSGDSVSSFLYQKEDGNKYHSYWGTPENQEKVQGTRKMYWTSSGASDIAADYAASLALSYLNFGNAEDLKYAKALYKFSTQYNQVATDGPTGFYTSSGCTDEQAFAAGWLYLATNDESYKNDCISKQVQYLGWVDGWDNRGLGAACVEAHITGNWNKVNSFITQFANEKTSSGYFFADKWGSARLNASMQFTSLVATKNSSANFTDWCVKQMNYLTGDNPSGTCFLTGFASNSAKNAHHRAASGYNSYDEFNGEAHPQSVAPNAPTLIGALVGGPTDANGSYVDDMNDYVCNEVAIDYNAGFVGASAGLYQLTNSKSTTSSSIKGVDKIYNGQAGNDNPVTPPVTTTPTPSTPSTSGLYEIKPAQKIVYSQLPEDDKMIGFKWADLGVGFDETVKSVEVNISTSGSKIGKWEGAFGSSTSSAPDYWTQSDAWTENYDGKTATITWSPSADQAKLINKLSGDLKFGVWYIECDTFTIDSIVVKTDKYNGSAVVTTASTNKPSNTTVTTKSTNTPSNPSTPGVYEVKPNFNFDYNTIPEDERMIAFKWEDFNISAGETPTKVEVKISANGNIGKWQGAFGTSTSVSPDYWYMTDDMEQTISGNSATITWNIDSATAAKIQTKYNGELKFGTWWVDCQRFTIDSVKVYTSGGSTSTTNPPDTKPTTPSSGNTLYGDANCDGKIEIADATLILQFLTNKDEYSLTDQGMKNADVTGNGDGVTAQDALVIQQVDAGIYKVSDLPIK